MTAKAIVRIAHAHEILCNVQDERHALPLLERLPSHQQRDGIWNLEPIS
jgi:hypothetical protein